MSYTPITNCLACNSSKLFKFLDLKSQPPANSYVETPCQQPSYPLGLQYCETCTHVQLTVQVNPDELFKNYLYVSGTSKTGQQYFKDFVGVTQKYVESINNVLDIACNDGSQLAWYKSAGYNTYGIDPAENLLPLSSAHGKVVCDYLTQNNIKSFGVDFDVIIAQNVFAHISYTEDFLQYCKSVLSDTGAIFVQTSQANMVFNGEFDTVYHEHLSFFSPESVLALAKRVGLYLVDILTPSIHGTSYVFILRKHGSHVDITKFRKVTKSTVESFSLKVVSIVSATKQIIDNYRSAGYKVVGYGAAAKSNTFINFSGITLDYILDDNSLKQGLYTPGSNILIKAPSTLLHESNKLLVIPLAWNFYDEIKSKVLRALPQAQFLRYYPYIHIE